MAKVKTPKTRFGWRILAGYAALNLLLFFTDPYASPWHYGARDPAPIEVMAPTDAALSLDQITRILDSIDLSYGAREPAVNEKVWLAGKQLTHVVFLPSSFALVMKSFLTYMGPANSQQRAFTVSVKQRYNHLARLAVNKGMRRDGFLFQEEASLSKKNGEAFKSLR
jgi:hypothetical protein